MQVRDTPVLIEADSHPATLIVGAGGSGINYGPSQSNLTGSAAPGSSVTLAAPTWVVSQGGRDGHPADVVLVDTPASPSAASGTASWANVKDFDAKGDAKLVTDGVISNGTATLTSATANFTAADRGKVIGVDGAGAGGVRLVTTIQAVVSATTVTLAATSAASGSGKRVNWGTDDTAALQAAINSFPNGGPVFIPYGVYLITNTLQLLDNTTLRGAGWSGGFNNASFFGSVIDATTFVSGTFAGTKQAIKGSNNNTEGLLIENLALDGPMGINATDSETQGSIGIEPGDYAQDVKIAHVRVRGFSQGIFMRYLKQFRLDTCWVSSARNHGVVFFGNINNGVVTGTLSQTTADQAAAGATTYACNWYFRELSAVYYPYKITLYNSLYDETGSTAGATIRIRYGDDITITNGTVHPYGGCIGVIVGDQSGVTNRVKLKNLRVEPYNIDSNHIPTNTIAIRATANATLLEDITTNPNGGGDITDAGVGTVYRNVNGRSTRPQPRIGGWAPTNALAETLPSRAEPTSFLTPVSGRLELVGGIVLPPRLTVSSISFMSDGTASAGLTNQWYCLVDQAGNVLATTLDDGATAWGTHAVKTLQIASAIGGAVAGTYTPAVELPVYLGILVVGTTPPPIKALSSQANLSALAPAINGSSNTGLTTPASLPATVTLPTGGSRTMYAYVS